MGYYDFGYRDMNLSELSRAFEEFEYNMREKWDRQEKQREIKDFIKALSEYDVEYDENLIEAFINNDESFNIEEFRKSDFFSNIVNTVYDNVSEDIQFFDNVSFGNTRLKIEIFRQVDDLEAKRKYAISQGYYSARWCLENEIFSSQEDVSFIFREVVINSAESIYNQNGFEIDTKVVLSEGDMEKYIMRVMEDEVPYSYSYNKKASQIAALSIISEESKTDYILSHISELEKPLDMDDYETQKSLNKFGVILETLSEKKLSELFEKVDKFSKAKLLRSLGQYKVPNFGECLENIVSSLENPNELESALVDLENNLALINLDIDEIVTPDLRKLLNANINGEEFFESDLFKEIINNFYGALDTNEKEHLIRTLSSRNETELSIFKAISDDNKYNVINNFTKKELLMRNAIDDPYINVQFLTDLYIEGETRFLRDYSRNQHEFGGFRISDEEFASIVEKIETKTAHDTYSLEVPADYLAIYSSIHKDNRIAYLRSNPEQIGHIIDSLDFGAGEINELLDGLDDAHKGRLLLSSIASLSDLIPYMQQIDDYYIATQITLGKHNDTAQTPEISLANIARYEQIKKEILSMPVEERADYLGKLGNVPGQIEMYKDYNEMKKSMLKYIENPEDRKKVIGSMQRYIEPEIHPYGELVEKMIKEYFADNGGLTPEMEERMEMTFRSMDLYYTDYENSCVTGKCSFTNKSVTITNGRREQPMETLLDMIHEYSHAFSKFYWTTTNYHMGDRREEGMADVFGEQVLNYYLEKYGSIDIMGIVITSESCPLISTSNYYEANGYAKTMLYPLEEEGKDVEAIKEFLLGSKVKFVELTMGTEFSSRFEENPKGDPLDFEVTLQEIYAAHPDKFESINTDSLYFQKNFILPAFVIQERTEGRADIHVAELGDRSFNEHYINNTYFNNRKLYEVSFDEYSEFAELYERAKCPEYRFVQGIEQYIDMKFSEIDDEEIQEHSAEILMAGAGLLANVPNIGTRVQSVLDFAMESQLEKIEEMNGVEEVSQAIDLYKKIFPTMIDIFDKGDGNTATELTESLEDFRDKFLEGIGVAIGNMSGEEFLKLGYEVKEFEKVPELAGVLENRKIDINGQKSKTVEIDNVEFFENGFIPIMGENWFKDGQKRESQEINENSKKQTNETILIEGINWFKSAEEAKLRFGEVSAAAFSLERDIANMEIQIREDDER